MTVAIMQPYYMPYIGYFQMINAVDSFVFYDDVNFINRGWVNRNRILVNNEPSYITIPLLKASQNKLINEIEINYDKNFDKITKTIQLNYKKSPFFERIYPLIVKDLTNKYKTISDLAINSCITSCQYLGIDTKFYISSRDFADTKSLDRAERLQTICKKLNANRYINAIGGEELYSKEGFLKQKIELKFIKSKPIEYKQFSNEFAPWLSIIDITMFNPKESIHKMLEQYELI